MTTRSLRAVPYDAATHGAQVDAWEVARLGRPSPEGYRPDTGIVIEDAEGPCACLFVWHPTSGRRLFIDDLIARPGLSPGKARDAVSTINDELVRIARESAYACITTTVDSPGLLGTLVRLGWTARKEPARLAVLLVPRLAHRPPQDKTEGTG